MRSNDCKCTSTPLLSFPVISPPSIHPSHPNLIPPPKRVVLVLLHADSLARQSKLSQSYFVHRIALLKGTELLGPDNAMVSYVRTEFADFLSRTGTGVNGVNEGGDGMEELKSIEEEIERELGEFRLEERVRRGEVGGGFGGSSGSGSGVVQSGGILNEFEDIDEDEDEDE